MAYDIQEQDGFFEVRVSGETVPQEILGAVMELRRRDPKKQRGDLWQFSEASQLTFIDFQGMVEAIHHLCTPGMAGGRSAFVSDDEFLRAQAELYRAEASVLPFEFRVFASRDEAVRWLKGGPRSVV